MALFFDTMWFSERLSALGLERRDLALAAGWSVEELTLAWKDQREIKADEVQAIAALLGEPPSEVAVRCGVSTSATPKAPTTDLQALEARVTRLEALVSALAARIHTG